MKKFFMKKFFDMNAAIDHCHAVKNEPLNKHDYLTLCGSNKLNYNEIPAYITAKFKKDDYFFLVCRKIMTLKQVPTI